MQKLSRQVIFSILHFLYKLFSCQDIFSTVIFSTVIFTTVFLNSFFLDMEFSLRGIFLTYFYSLYCTLRLHALVCTKTAQGHVQHPEAIRHISGELVYCILLVIQRSYITRIPTLMGPQDSVLMPNKASIGCKK